LAAARGRYPKPPALQAIINSSKRDIGQICRFNYKGASRHERPSCRNAIARLTEKRVFTKLLRTISRYIQKFLYLFNRFLSRAFSASTGIALLSFLTKMYLALLFEREFLQPIELKNIFSNLADLLTAAREHRFHYGNKKRRL
jgi:hypothetical protein